MINDKFRSKRKNEAKIESVSLQFNALINMLRYFPIRGVSY